MAHATITDFTVGGIEDEIEVRTDVGFNENFQDILDHSTQVGANTLIDMGFENTITLLGVDRSNLTAADFVFE